MFTDRPQPVREVTNDKLKTVINDRDRLQRDLSDMHRKYERLESRSYSYLFFIHHFKFYVYLKVRDN